MIRKSFLTGALLVAAACGGGDGGPAPLVVTTVSVTATPTQITVGATAQASAIVKDQNGNALTGKSVTWTSLNPSVASVNSSSGLITGVSAGTSTIQGTVENVSGTATVIVIAAVSACNTGITVVDLPVGGTRVLTATETQGCIKLPATSGSPADYMVIAGNTSSTPDILGNYVIKSDEGENVPSSTIAPSNTIFSAEGFAPAAAVGDLGAAQIAFETRLRLMERRDLRIPDAQRAYRERLRAAPEQRYAVSSAIPSVGDRLSFKVPGKTNACNNFTTITAEVVYINDKVIIYNDLASPANGFSATDYQQIGDEFATVIYPTDVSYFGTPLDDDNNGRVIILYTAEVNKLSDENSSSFVGGFFFAGDLFPSTGPPGQACAQSNMAELFYLLAPDPDGTIKNNKRSLALVRQNTRGTIAHEFQHMINASERIRSPILQDFEDVWLDEALAHFAEDAVGRVVRGVGETEDATFTRLLSGNVDDFNAFFFQNFARFRIYLQNPGPFGPTSSQADTSLSARGAAWALLRYTADHYSGGDVKAFTKRLAGGPDTGVGNLVKNAAATFDAIVSGWLIANYADNASIPGLAVINTYKVYNMRSNLTSINNGFYPLKVNDVTGTGFVMTDLKARSGSGNYFFAQRNAGAPARTWRFLNSDGSTAASFTGAAWLILRTR